MRNENFGMHAIESHGGTMNFLGWKETYKWIRKNFASQQKCEHVLALVGESKHEYQNKDNLMVAGAMYRANIVYH